MMNKKLVYKDERQSYNVEEFVKAESDILKVIDRYNEKTV